MMERGGTLFYDASAIIFVAKAPNDGAFSPDLDCGIVTANLILAARALGVDSVVCGFAGVLFEGAGASELRRQLQFPEGFDFSIAVLLGYNSGEPKAPHTPDLSKIIEID
jgi:nitroreductase